MGTASAVPPLGITWASCAPSATAAGCVSSLLSLQQAAKPVASYTALGSSPLGEAERFPEPQLERRCIRSGGSGRDAKPRARDVAGAGGTRALLCLEIPLPPACPPSPPSWQGDAPLLCSDSRQDPRSLPARSDSRAAPSPLLSRLLILSGRGDRSARRA